MESVLKLDSRNIIDSLDELLNMKKKVPESLKKNFNKTVVTEFLEKRGLKGFNINIYYDKLLKIVNNILISDIQIGGAGGDESITLYQQGERNSKKIIYLLLTFAWLILNFASIILGVRELFNVAEYPLVGNINTEVNFNVQDAAPEEAPASWAPSRAPSRWPTRPPPLLPNAVPEEGLVLYNEPNGQVVVLDRLLTYGSDGSNIIVAPSPQEIQDVLTLGQLLTLNPEIGQILTRHLNSRIARVIQEFSGRLYDSIHDNYEETTNRAGEVLNPSAVFSEDPVTWFSVGMGSVMSYLRFETTEEIIRLKEQMEDELTRASRELEDFRINIMRNAHGQLRYIVRRLEIALILIKIGAGGLLATLVEYLRRRRLRYPNAQFSGHLTESGAAKHEPEFVLLNGGIKRKKKKKTRRKIRRKTRGKTRGKTRRKTRGKTRGKTRRKTRGKNRFKKKVRNR